MSSMVIKLRKYYILFALLLILSLLFSPKEKSIEAVGSQSVELPVIMYHQISRKNSNTGKYIISREQLVSDLEYIKKMGYTTVTVKDLINYVNGKGSLPEKPVMLTFDDGHETAYTILYPLLKEMGMCAVVSVIGYLADLYTEIDDHNDTYSYLTWDEIKELSDTPEIEIQNHSFNMHSVEKGGRRGIAPMKGESRESYFSAVNADVGKMQLELMKKGEVKATAMVYPYGSHTELTLEVCKDLGFLCTMTCEERINTVTKYNTASLYNLGRYNRSGEMTAREFFADILN